MSQPSLNITPSGKTTNVGKTPYPTSVRGRGKTNIPIKFLEEQRLQNILNSKPKQSNSVIVEQSTYTQKINDIRRNYVNKIKESLVVKFQNKVSLISHKKRYENGYTDEHFCKDMGLLIEDFQGRLDKIKIKGKFY